MSNHARGGKKGRTPPKTAMSQRPAGELLYSFKIAPPDGDRNEDGTPVLVQVDVDLRRFTLAERQLVKKALLKFAQPPEFEDVIVVHAWVVWRRTHPESSLDLWMNDIEWGDFLDGLSVEPGHTQWDTTPEGYDPEA